MNFEKFREIKEDISKMSKSTRELDAFYGDLGDARSQEEKKMIISHINSLKKIIKESNEKLEENLNKISLMKKIQKKEIDFPEPRRTKLSKESRKKLKEIEKQTLKRLLKEEEKQEKVKEKKPSSYVRYANKSFGKKAQELLEKGAFKNLKQDLIRANIQQLTKSYVSIIFLSTLVSLGIALFIFIFFLFFNFGVRFPFITLAQGNIISRIGVLFWVLIILPLGTFLFMLAYPSMEKKSLEALINRELPFAVIHMASISESMIEPTNVFRIMIKSGEYPNLKKEFTKIMNEINILGHDLITTLRNNSFNSPSRKLSELYGGMATTITSGGDLANFFDKRAQTLLFDYKLDREKNTKMAETFMDIYISVVIAAPMILMLLLIMIKVSGLGIALSTGMISAIMVLGVSVVNAFFLMFLQMKQPKD